MPHCIPLHCSCEGLWDIAPCPLTNNLDPTNPNTCDPAACAAGSANPDRPWYNGCYRCDEVARVGYAFVKVRLGAARARIAAHGSPSLLLVIPNSRIHAPHPCSRLSRHESVVLMLCVQDTPDPANHLLFTLDKVRVRHQPIMCDEWVCCSQWACEWVCRFVVLSHTATHTHTCCAYRTYSSHSFDFYHTSQDVIAARAYKPC